MKRRILIAYGVTHGVALAYVLILVMGIAATTGGHGPWPTWFIPATCLAPLVYLLGGIITGRVCKDLPQRPAPYLLVALVFILLVMVPTAFSMISPAAGIGEVLARKVPSVLEGFVKPYDQDWRFCITVAAQTLCAVLLSGSMYLFRRRPIGTTETP